MVVFSALEGIDEKVIIISSAVIILMAVILSIFFFGKWNREVFTNNFELFFIETMDL